MNIWKSTKNYEEWLAKYVRLIPAEIELKHHNMASDVFLFLRGTFYWWAGVWESVCPELADAPEVLAVGDLHVENFGSWRDFLARLTWGINDFDEAYYLPYTNDLLRLATSALLALESNRFKQLTPEAACKAILEGYEHGIESGGKPFVLDEHQDLEKMLSGYMRRPHLFWEKFRALRKTSLIALDEIPSEALSALKSTLPEPRLKFEVVHRIAGQGSLGRERYTLLSSWCGGPIAMEVKGLAPSACTFVKSVKSKKIYYMQIMRNAVRCHDPFIRVYRNQLLRRLAPDCCRIELSTLPALSDEKLLLNCMGFEVANFHLGSENARKLVLSDLRRRPQTWLVDGATKMAKKVRKAQKQYSKKFNEKMSARAPQK